MKSTIMFSIVIPCYNEALNIPLILQRFAECLNRDDLEVVLVDNGSTDESAEIIFKLLPSYAFARSTRVSTNQGYGFGILAGLSKTRGEFIGWTHADMQTDPRDVITACEIFQANHFPHNTYIKGSRKGRPILDTIFTCGMSIFETAYLGVSLWDINAQPNMFHRSFFESWQTPPYDFSLDLFAYYAAKKHRLRLLRFPVQFPERTYGESKWNKDFSSKWKFIKRTIIFSLELKKMLRIGTKNQIVSN